jgi:uncharacterized protein (TIGR00730 family)
VDEDQRKPATFDEELLEAETPEVETLESDETRIARVDRELERGFDALAHVGPAVSVFGSARTPEGHPEYELARDTARLLGEHGFAIITGGGPGIMSAANRGAREADAISIGLDIELPHEEQTNRWVGVPLTFHYFFTRKVMFVRYASAFVVFPGGFGTLDELFESLTLIQTEKIHHFPVVLVGSGYWSGLLDWLRDPLISHGKADPEDMDLMQVTDDPQEVLRIVSQVEHRKPRRPANGQ